MSEHGEHVVHRRAHLLPAAEIRSELDRLQVLVDKTAGPRERAAMNYVLSVFGQAS